jgi:hypothetical protein
MSSRKAQHAAERPNLLACLLWLHAHLDDIAAAWPATTIVQQHLLETVIHLYFNKDALTVLATISSGVTPQRRKAPDAGPDGQIQCPGGQQPQDSVPAQPKKLKTSGGGFSSQQQHVYVTGSDCNSVPLHEVLKQSWSSTHLDIYGHRWI